MAANSDDVILLSSVEVCSETLVGCKASLERDVLVHAEHEHVLALLGGGLKELEDVSPRVRNKGLLRLITAENFDTYVVVVDLDRLLSPHKSKRFRT